MSFRIAIERAQVYSRGGHFGAVALLIAGCAPRVGQGGQSAIDPSQPYAGFEQLGRVISLVDDAYVEPVDHAKLLDGAIHGMLEHLDPHSAYMTPDEVTLFRSETAGRFGGVGIEVDLRHDAVTVIAPIDGSPAFRAGIRPGDRIVAVDGVPAGSEAIASFLRRLRGEPGTHVKVTIRRAASHSQVEVERDLSLDLVRELIHVKSVLGVPLASSVAYVRIRQFQEGTHEELIAVLAQLHQEIPEGFRALVLDLRTNPGGLVDEAAEVADEFLDEGLIYSTRSRSRTIDEVRARAGGAFRVGPMAVLVNSWSASAAELVSGALQDLHRASIIGLRTFGKGSVQTVFDLPGGAGMRLTTMRYYTPAGRSIQARGIEPDYRLRDPSAPTLPFLLSESGLDGHLEAEASRGSHAPIDVDVSEAMLAKLDTPSPPTAHAKPTRDGDIALAIAYELLSGSGSQRQGGR